MTDNPSLAPFLDDYPFTLQSTFQNNTLFSDHILRQRPSPAVDAAWDDLSRLTVMTLSADEVRALGKDPATAVHMPNNPSAFRHAGRHAPAALPEQAAAGPGDHLLHGNRSLTQMYWEHMYHCLHLITQTVTCHADADPILWTWVENQEHADPVFSGNMMCRDFDGFKAWLEGTGFDVHNVWLVQREGDEIEVPQEPGLLKLELELEQQQQQGGEEVEYK